jgi:putative oxidoreductase
MISTLCKRIVTSPYLAFGLRIYVGCFFIYASVSKIPFPAQFAEAIADYRLLPYAVLNLGAVILPWIEFVTGLFLIIGFRARASVILVGLMLIMFDVMILINMYWGAPITCGCYDTVGEPIGWKKISENALMLLFAVQIYLFDRLTISSKWGFITNTGKRVASPAASQ